MMNFIERDPDFGYDLDAEYAALAAATMTKC